MEPQKAPRRTTRQLARRGAESVARPVVQGEHRISLSEQDWERFAEILESPIVINEKMLQAVKRFRTKYDN